MEFSLHRENNFEIYEECIKSMLGTEFLFELLKETQVHNVIICESIILTLFYKIDLSNRRGILLKKYFLNVK